MNLLILDRKKYIPALILCLAILICMIIMVIFNSSSDSGSNLRHLYWMQEAWE